VNVKKDMVVTIDYTLRDEDGEVIDSSSDHGPLTYLHGGGNIIQGLEDALEGKSAGDTLNAEIAPEGGYGLRDEGLTQVIPRDVFGFEGDLEAGMQFQAPTENGDIVVTVVEATEDSVTVDGNHPLAGMPLHFEVTVLELRKATAEELESSHVHGASCEH